jgi:RNA polymerase sigma-70 factor, ECF subfamily
VTTAAHSPELERELELYRRELTRYCYRMLGSAFDAEDAVQETMVRAWRSLDRFEGRAALKSWLYRIATNVCLDMLNVKERRILPLELGDPGGLDSPLTTRGEAAWLEPIPADPAEVAQERETLKLAFVAALQHLPPQQRAVLILREALRWRANEVAELLDTSVASVNSALQRARASLDATEITPGESLDPLNEDQQKLLQRYVAAFESYDMDAIANLLHEDAKQSMPPYELWLLGREDILRWWFGPGIGCKGSRLVPVVANGLPAFGQYRPSGPGGSFEPWALQVLELSNGQIVGFTAFLDTDRLFPLFGLPPVPPE